MRGPLRSLVLVCSLIVAALALFACANDTAPPLIQVTDFTPREAEVGDRLEISGVGFPQGRSARVSLRGVLHRPGASRAPRVELVATGVVTSSRQIEVAYDEALEAELCTSGGKRLHTTFEGDVEVSFPAVVPGAPPVAATLRGVTLDLRPPVSPAQAQAAASDGERTLAFLGVTVSGGGSGGLLVEAVAPASRAERAGIGVGDKIVSFDHLRVAGKADLAPKPGRAVPIGIRRADESAELSRDVDIDGLSTAPSDELTAALVIALAAIALLLALHAPAETTSSLERRAALVLRSAGWAHRAPTAALVAACVWSIVFGALPAARYLVSADLDVLLLLACAIAATLIVKMAWGDFGVRRALGILGLEALSILAMGAIVYASGSLRLHDVVRTQGALPWEWHAFRDPGSLGSLVAFGLAGLAGTLEPPRATPPTTRLRHVLDAALACNAFVRAGIAAALFLGGWQLPAGWADGGAIGWVVAGGAFVLKTWILVFIGVAVRAAVRGDGRRPWRLTRSWILAAVLSAGVCVAWSVWSPPERVQLVVGTTLFGLAAIVVLRSLLRVRFFLRAGTREGRLDMFA